jgi:hypothetical protein
MRFEVYHNLVPTFVDPKFQEMQSLAKLFPFGFKRVAVVEAEHVGDVYRITNHIDINWTENPEVIQFDSAAVRSTSPGDVFVNVETGERYLVKGIGMEKF